MVASPVSRRERASRAREVLQESTACKNTDRRDDCRGGLLFPPERGEDGVLFQLRKGNRFYRLTWHYPLGETLHN